MVNNFFHLDIFLISSYEISRFLTFENLKYDACARKYGMCARKYGMCARKYGPLGHQIDKIQNDIISSHEVSGLHITSPIVFFSRKLSTMQQKYSVTEIELLVIVETLKEFKGMLWGQKIKVYTDHKNLIQDALSLNSDQV